MEWVDCAAGGVPLVACRRPLFFPVMAAQVLAVIPARGGSKSIPRKNIRTFLGRPLLAWTIESAARSGVCDRLVLSTDDPEIAEVGQAYGAERPFLRPPELATDQTATAPVLRHALDWMRAAEGWTPEVVIVLEPTSPGRRPFHVREAVALLRRPGVDSVASVSEVPHHYAPPKLLRISPDGWLSGMDGTHPREMIHRRQDLPRAYAFDGVFFGCRSAWLLRDPPTLWGDKVLAYPVDPKYSVDLDRPEDWEPAEARLRVFLLGSVA